MKRPNSPRCDEHFTSHTLSESMLGTKDAQPMDLAVQQDHHRNVPTHAVECKFFGATSCFQVLDTERLC